MNNRQIKLALSTELIYVDRNTNVLQIIREIMLGFKEVGHFLKQTLTGKVKINASTENQRYELQFENCTLDVELISNENTRNKYVRGFNIR